MEFQHVFNDIRAEFIENIDLGLRLDPGVYDRLYDLFNCSLVPLLSTGRISWEHHDRQRKFVLSCAAGLGRKVNGAAAGKGREHITREDVEAAARYLVDYWQAICVLPPPRAMKKDETGQRSCPVRDLLEGGRPSGDG